MDTTVWSSIGNNDCKDPCGFNSGVGKQFAPTMVGRLKNSTIEKQYAIPFIPCMELRRALYFLFFTRSLLNEYIFKVIVVALAMATDKHIHTQACRFTP